MTKFVLGAGFVGVLIGSALSAYAHTENGFLTGPVVVLGLVVSIAGALGAALLIVIGNRSPVVYCLASFSEGMLIVLILLPLVWPYTARSKPVPLSRIPGLKLRGSGTSVLLLLTSLRLLEAHGEY
jgi:hypothetical protein